MTQRWRHAVPLPDGGVWLGPDAAALVRFALGYFAAATRAQNGTADLHPLAREVTAACDAVVRGMSEVGPVARTSPPEASPSSPDDLLTTAQIAEELHVTERQARRLAVSGRLGVVTRAGRAIQVRRFEVDAHRNRGRNATR